MFDIGWQEIFVIAVFALIVIGPKDLPRTLKTVTGVIRKMKGMARDFQSGMDDIVRESELMDMKKQIEAETGGDLRKEIENSIDPDGAISKDLQDLGDFENDMKSAAQRHADSVSSDPSDEITSPASAQAADAYTNSDELEAPAVTQAPASSDEVPAAATVPATPVAEPAADVKKD